MGSEGGLGRVREEYWNTVVPENPQRPFNRDVLANAGALRDVDSIVLWLGAGAAEQLLLAWSVQLLKLIGSRAQVHLVQFTREFTREFHVNAWGLSLLHPEQIRQHPPVERLSAESILEVRTPLAARDFDRPRRAAFDGVRRIGSPAAESRELATTYVP